MKPQQQVTHKKRATKDVKQMSVGSHFKMELARSRLILASDQFRARARNRKWLDIVRPAAQSVLMLYRATEFQRVKCVMDAEAQTISVYYEKRISLAAKPILAVEIKVTVRRAEGDGVVMFRSRDSKTKPFRQWLQLHAVELAHSIASQEIVNRERRDHFVSSSTREELA